MTTKNTSNGPWYSEIMTPLHLSPELHPVDDGNAFDATLARKISDSVHMHLLMLGTHDASMVECDVILRREIERLVNTVKEEMEAHATIIAATAKERQDQAEGVRCQLSGYMDRGAEIELQRRGPRN